MGLLDRLVPPSGRQVHSAEKAAANTPEHADESTPTADILPLSGEQDAQATKVRRNVLVAVSGTEQDRELVSLACALSKQKNMDVHMVYGIEVPRSLPVDAEMPEETDEAGAALDTADEVARDQHVRAEKEIIQSRSFGQSLVEESEARGCSLIMLSVPYGENRQGSFDIGETADYVLKHAPCRVWVVRGQPPVSEQSKANARVSEQPTVARDERQRAHV